MVWGFHYFPEISLILSAVADIFPFLPHLLPSLGSRAGQSGALTSIFYFAASRMHTVPFLRAYRYNTLLITWITYFLKRVNYSLLPSKLLNVLKTF